MSTQSLDKANRAVTDEENKRASVEVHLAQMGKDQAVDEESKDLINVREEQECRGKAIATEEPKEKGSNSRVEAIIKHKLGRNFNGEDFIESQFDVLLLEGLDLGSELTEDDKAFLERFKHAKCLNMSNCNLRSLKNMPAISGLEQLVLQDNSFTGEDFHVLHQTYKKLKQLNLSNNCIRKLDCMDHLAKIVTLKSLDLSANPITDQGSYRLNLFEKVPHLEALDGYDKSGDECSFDAGDELRNDNDDFMDNEFQGGFFEQATLMMRKGSNHDSSDKNEEDDSESQASEDSDAGAGDEKEGEKMTGEQHGERIPSSISDGDPCAKK